MKNNREDAYFQGRANIITDPHRIKNLAANIVVGRVVKFDQKIKVYKVYFYNWRLIAGIGISYDTSPSIIYLIPASKVDKETAIQLLQKRN